jgi:hypothetical protein
MLYVTDCLFIFELMSQSRLLAGRVALVAGATRGCGRAIAVELGALGATVYGSGRTTRDERSEMDRPETIEDTAELVDAAGGTGIAVRCDHAVGADVAALVDRIRAEHGRLDVLVNDVWGGDPFTRWVKGVWEHPLDDTLRIVRNGIETHLITAHHALPLLIETGDGLVVRRRRHGTGRRPSRRRPPTWRDASDAHGGYFRYSETPHLLGRGVAALAADPDRARFAGQCLGSWDLMHTYDFTDADGERPDWGVVDVEARAAVAEAALPAAE